MLTVRAKSLFEKILIDFRSKIRRWTGDVPPVSLRWTILIHFKAVVLSRSLGAVPVRCSPLSMFGGGSLVFVPRVAVNARCEDSLPCSAVAYSLLCGSAFGTRNKLELRNFGAVHEACIGDLLMRQREAPVP